MTYSEFNFSVILYLHKLMSRNTYVKAISSNFPPTNGKFLTQFISNRFKHYVCILYILFTCFSFEILLILFPRSSWSHEKIKPKMGGPKWRHVKSPLTLGDAVKCYGLVPWRSGDLRRFWGLQVPPPIYLAVWLKDYRAVGDNHKLSSQFSSPFFRRFLRRSLKPISDNLCVNEAERIN